MPQLIPIVLVALGVLVLMAWVLSRGSNPKASDRIKKILDPLTLNALSESTARVFLSVPNTEGDPETLSLVVNQSTRELFLRYGPIYFADGFSEMAYIEQARCLVGSSRDEAEQLRLTRLYQKLFQDNDVFETVGLIHAMTEVDFMALEDEQAIEQHVLHCGFESVAP